jgi:hypothetical protein
MIQSSCQKHKDSSHAVSQAALVNLNENGKPRAKAEPRAEMGLHPADERCGRLPTCHRQPGTSLFGIEIAPQLWIDCFGV